jgi:hypothetical protein
MMSDLLYRFIRFCKKKKQDGLRIIPPIINIHLDPQDHVSDW